MNVLRRLTLSRLLLVCALVLAIGVSATAIAFALDTGPTPPPKPLAQAIHDALEGTAVEGMSASIVLSNHLLEGANLASGGHGGELTSSPLVTGASGRLWIAKDGDFRLELQSQKGDTQILSDGHTLSLYDAATNTLYRYTPPAHQEAGEPWSGSGGPGSHQDEVPSVAKIEEAISHLSQHANVSGAMPTDVAGAPAYTVRVSPNEGGSLFGGVELSFDADHGVPLRAALYSSTGSTPVAELAATEVSYGPVAASVFELSPPANVKVQEVQLPKRDGTPGSGDATHGAGKPKVTTYGHGVSSIAVVASSRDGEAKPGAGERLEGLPKVTIDGTSADELSTELGTLLTFERSGVRYLLAGSVTPSAIEAVARGL